MSDSDIKLTAMPDRMVNDGGCKSRIVASVSEKGEPSQKTALYVGTTWGELYALEETEFAKTQQGDKELVKVKTDDRGHATMGLRLDSALGIAHLAAGKKKGDVAAVLAKLEKGEDLGRPPKGVATTRVVIEAGKPYKIILETDADQVTADGVSTALITATVTDKFGNPIAGSEVSFQTDLGTIDPGRVNCLTDENGRATTTLSSHKTGKADLIATNRYRSWLEDVIPNLEKRERKFGFLKERNSAPTTLVDGEETLSDRVSVRFVPSAPSSLIVSADRSSLPADGRSRVCISALIKDEFGSPIDGQGLVFETDLGEIEPKEAVTGSDGGATVHLTSTKVGDASVRVRTLGEGDGLLSAIQVTFEAASPATVQLSSDPETNVADGKSECLVSAWVRDEMGNPVPGKTIAFETDLGSIAPGPTAVSDKDGRADVRLTSRVAGVAHISCRCEGASGGMEIEFRSGPAKSIAMALNPTVEEGWRNRIPADHIKQLQHALRHLEERRFTEAIGVLEKEKERIERTSNLPALCDLAFAYQQSGRKKEAEAVYNSIIQRNGARREIRVTVNELGEAFGVVLPGANGGEAPAEKEFMDLDPRDYLINIVVTDDNGNQIPGLPVQFDANFGWVPEEYRKASTNQAGAASSVVTTFAPLGSSEIEFAWVNLGLMKENALDYAGAEECYRSAIRVMPESTRALECLASVLVKTGNVDEAKKCYYNLGRAYSKKGQFAKAIEHHNKAIELDPKYARALAGSGSAYLRLGELSRARRYLEESVRLSKSLKAAQANLGLLYYLVGEFDKAIAMNKRALKLDPDFKPALVNLHQIHMARGERDKAREYSTKIRQLG